MEGREERVEGREDRQLRGGRREEGRREVRDRVRETQGRRVEEDNGNICAKHILCYSKTPTNEATQHSVPTTTCSDKF